MSGKTVTEQQVRLYMKAKQEDNNQQVSAAKAGISIRSARRIDRKKHPFADKKEHHWRTRKDPLDKVWLSECLPLLQEHPGLQARSLLQELQKRHKGDFGDHLLRTMQRRVREWKAVEGPGKEIIFRQKHPPGLEGSSDFTCANELHVTIAGEPFPHRFYQFRLSYSLWRYVQVVQGGESFTALSEGLQNALEALGGTPKQHRTDSLSAAYRNLAKDAEKDFTESYEELCQQYQMKAVRNNKGVSHENGTIESSHRHFKSEVEQALLLRGNRDFESLEAYRCFISEMAENSNSRNRTRVEEERLVLQPLPEQRTRDYAEKRMKVTNSSTIRIFGVTYSVPSRLVGYLLMIRIYDDRLECFLGTTHLLKLKRCHRNKATATQIDYRHFIDSLVRKPQAFRNFVFQDELFPTLTFRKAWEQLDSHLDERQACREYVAILQVAANHEATVEDYLQACLSSGVLPSGEALREQFSTKRPLLPELKVAESSLDSYDALLLGGRP